MRDRGQRLQYAPGLTVNVLVCDRDQAAVLQFADDAPHLPLLQLHQLHKMRISGEAIAALAGEAGDFRKQYFLGEAVALKV
jgi:hypothetical protein